MKREENRKKSSVRLSPPALSNCLLHIGRTPGPWGPCINSGVWAKGQMHKSISQSTMEKIRKRTNMHVFFINTVLLLLLHSAKIQSKTLSEALSKCYGLRNGHSSPATNNPITLHSFLPHFLIFHCSIQEKDSPFFNGHLPTLVSNNGSWQMPHPTHHSLPKHTTVLRTRRGARDFKHRPRRSSTPVP